MRLNRLWQLLADNRHTYTPIEQRVQLNAETGEATLYLYDPIVGDSAMAEWFGGVCPQEFVPALHAIKAERINLRIDCPGGDVFAAEAMCQALREHPASIVAHVDGLAASAATSICCACDDVQISAGSMYMIHESWTLAIGNKRDMRAIEQLLAKCDDTMLDDYEAFTGQSREQLVSWIEAETWFNAEEAVRHGFAKSVKPRTAKASAAARNWNLNAFLSRVARPDPQPAQTAEDPTPDRTRQQQRLRALLAAPIA